MSSMEVPQEPEPPPSSPEEIRRSVRAWAIGVAVLAVLLAVAALLT
jgi:hypothetical protein